MKNYLYILCAFLLAFAGCTKDADVEPIAPAPDGNTQVVLTGFSGRGTRTGFGGAEDGAVPFLWSAGDYIWARNTRSEAIAEGGSQATFVFESLETADTYDVFYNLTGPAAATALIPAEQTQQAAGELNLGQNGDFGYATAQNGTFTLEHATSYVWFDTYSSDVTSNLLSITLSVSGGQTIAGEAAFADGKLGDCKGSSSVTLSFGEEGVALPSQSNDTDVFAAMVLYPADLSTATVSIVYKFADGSVYLQTKSGKTLTPGHTLRLSTQIAKSDCKNSGAFFMTEAGVAEELPTEPIGYLKVVTLGESTLSAEELTSIAGNLANGAVIDLGEATFATTEFPMDFTRKTNLQEIALPRNIQTFTPSTYNSGAFYGCENLTRVTFPEGLTAIGQNCFRNCAKLESIELPSSVRTLDIYAFYGCKLLTSVVIPEGVDGTLTLSRFDRLSGLGTTFGVLTQAGALRYEHLALANTFEFPLIETTGNITVTDCPILRSVLLPALTDAGSLEITGCPAIETLSFPKAERFDGDVSLATLPAIKDFGEFLPALKAISGDLSIDDLSSLEGVLDLSGCTFSPNSTLDLRLVAATRLTELRGGDFGGSLRIDASSLTPQPEAMPFGITGFKNLDTLRIAGFTHVSELSLPTESCDDLTIENCGSQAPFTLSLPNLVEVRGTLLCRNCGKAGEANSASFPRLKNVGRQLSFYVGASSFTVLEFPLLETVGNGEPVSDDPADDYALYTMPSGCAGEFILPSLQRVNGSMLVSTWNTSTDRAVAFRFPSLQSVAGEISVGHTAYKNRSVATLDFSALTAAGAIRIGNLSSVTDFSTFTQVLPRLSEQTWSVTDCSYNPTYQQMLDGETGAESK